MNTNEIKFSRITHDCQSFQDSIYEILSLYYNVNRHLIRIIFYRFLLRRWRYQWRHRVITCVFISVERIFFFTLMAYCVESWLSCDLPTMRVIRRDCTRYESSGSDAFMVWTLRRYFLRKKRGYFSFLFFPDLLILHSLQYAYERHQKKQGIMFNVLLSISLNWN